MKTTDEIINESIGLSLDSSPLTPMDKGECQYCMNKYLEEYKLAKCEVLDKWRLLHNITKDDPIYLDLIKLLEKHFGEHD